jgi:hypothetical protein
VVKSDITLDPFSPNGGTSYSIRSHKDSAGVTIGCSFLTNRQYDAVKNWAFAPTGKARAKKSK